MRSLPHWNPFPANLAAAGVPELTGRGVQPVETLAARGVSEGPSGALQAKRRKRGKSGGVRGGRQPSPVRKPRALTARELGAVSPICPWSQVVGGASTAAYAERVGVDLAKVRDASGARERAKTLRWLDDTVRTRRSKAHPNGRPRRDRVQHCGTLYAARQGAAYGLAHKWCRDRMCPGCMDRRQRTEAKLLRRWVRSRFADGADILFANLTQLKLPIEHETAAQAIARLFSSRRAMMNTKTEGGRALRTYVAGGVWYTEIVWSYRGKRNKDGSVVQFSGWHPHLHGLVELTPPPAELVQKLGVDRAREVWKARAAVAFKRAWFRQNPEASNMGQHVVRADDARVGQVCKYPLKPFEIETHARAREAALALGAKRTHDAFGTWRAAKDQPGWRERAEQLLEQERKRRGEVDPEPVEFGDATFQGLACRAQVGARVYFHPPGGNDGRGVSAVSVLAAVHRDPRTLQQRAADKAAQANEAQKLDPAKPSGLQWVKPAGARVTPGEGTWSHSQRGAPFGHESTAQTTP